MSLPKLSREQEGLIAGVLVGGATCLALFGIKTGPTKAPANPDVKTTQQIERVMRDAAKLVLSNDHHGPMYADIVCAPAYCKERTSEGFLSRRELSNSNKTTRGTLEVNIDKVNDEFHPNQTYALRTQVDTCGPGVTPSNCVNDDSFKTGKTAIFIKSTTTYPGEPLPRWNIEIHDNPDAEDRGRRFIEYEDQKGINEALGIVRLAMRTPLGPIQ